MNSEEKNRKQREYRKINNNICTKKYEKTKKGFLMRLYRNIKSRISGIQKEKYHLYKGKKLDISKEDFYNWALANPVFHSLYEDYVLSNYEQKLAPSIDRIDSSLGYIFTNIEFVTHSENSRRGNLSRRINENSFT